MFELTISGSKSESNRALILQSFSPSIGISNLSDSDDTQRMQKALLDLKQGLTNLECGHAGTVIRFLIARAVFQPNFSALITGSRRLLSRPIQDLIDALKPFAKNIVQTEKGIEIESLNSFPENANFTIDATNSSQFVSALCLCAPRFTNGITINITGALSSIPYITMTLDFLKQQGYGYTFENRTIEIKPNSGSIKTLTIEPDWSSLSYWFSAAVITQQPIFLKHYQSTSLQADASILDFAAHFGIDYSFSNAGLVLTPKGSPSINDFIADFDRCPDIAPTFMALCAAINMPCKLTGLHSLKHKECDRIVVMHENLKRLGFVSQIDNTSFATSKSNTKLDYNKPVVIKTDLDHRIAMSIAPLQFLFKNISFDDEKVVSKSYQNFWGDLSAFQNHLNL